jgi:uncharacterized protein YndB with AHSA1/START domain
MSDALPQKALPEKALPQKALPETAELTYTRVFDAPRELVFRCMTDPGHLARFWGPPERTRRRAASRPTCGRAGSSKP